VGLQRFAPCRSRDGRDSRKVVVFSRFWPVVSSLATLAAVVALVATPACSDDDEAPAAVADAGPDTDPGSPPAENKSDARVDGVPVIEVDCPIGTAVEFEDNDTPAKANEFQELSFCGALTPASDVDYSKFTTPRGKKLVLFQGVIDGVVDFDLLVNGKTLRPEDVKDFEAGEYVVKAYTKDGKPGRYRYRIQFEP
jgi:hypothetical protein